MSAKNNVPLVVGAFASVLTGIVTVVLVALLPNHDDDSWRGFP